MSSEDPSAADKATGMTADPSWPAITYEFESGVPTSHMIDPRTQQTLGHQQYMSAPAPIIKAGLPYHPSRRHSGQPQS